MIGLGRLGLAVALAAFAWASAFAAEKAPAEKKEARAAQEKCPMTGKKLADVATPVVIEVEGFKMTVTDGDAAYQVAQDPAKAFAALERNRDAAEPVSRACPIMGNLVNESLFVQRKGRRVYVCCKGCIKKVEKDWVATLAKLAQQAKDGDPEDLKPM